MTLHKTPLHKTCRELGCRMVEFAGWELPIQFSSLIDEHNSVRRRAGIFDISHMGVFFIQGINPKDALQSLVPSDLHRIGHGEACYTVLLNEAGGIIDDLIIYDLESQKDNLERVMIVINASCIDSDLAWLKKHLITKKLEISNAKRNQILIALQGPEAEHHLNKVLDKPLINIPKFGHKELQIKINDKSDSMFIARTGYTGEDGFEILIDNDTGKELWCQLIKNGVQPCGLGARDTLRLEAAMPLYGNDINQNTTPFEAGLGWLVHLEEPSDFIGKNALILQNQQGIHQKLVAIKLDEKAIPRKGYPIILHDEFISQITSGSWSPTLNKGIALAYLPVEAAKEGTKICVKIRDKLHPATVVKKPFYRRVS